MLPEEPTRTGEPILTESSSEFWGPIEKLAGALSKAQAEFSPVKKSSQNPFFKRSDGSGGKYADLSEIIDATRPALSKHGLSVVQLPSCDGKMVTVTTLLLHDSGAGIRSVLSVPGEKQNKLDVQTIGSAMTYARRFSYQAVVHVAGEDDDDGNAASGKRHQKPADEAGELSTETADKPIRMGGIIEAESEKDEFYWYKLKTLTNEGETTILVRSPKETDSGRLAEKIGWLVDIEVVPTESTRAGVFTLVRVLNVRKPLGEAQRLVEPTLPLDPEKPRETPTNAPQTSSSGKVISDKQLKRLFAMAREVNVDDARLHQMAGYEGFEHLPELTVPAYNRICDELTNLKLGV